MHGFKLVLLLFTLTLFSCRQSPVTDSNPTGDVIESTYLTIPISALDSLQNLYTNEVIVDVRTPGETAKGTIPGAIEIDYKSPQFQASIEKLDKEKTYLLYCRSGKRSMYSARIMNIKGFENVVNLDGGYNLWSKTKEID